MIRSCRIVTNTFSTSPTKQLPCTLRASEIVITEHMGSLATKDLHGWLEILYLTACGVLSELWFHFSFQQCAIKQFESPSHQTDSCVCRSARFPIVRSRLPLNTNFARSALPSSPDVFCISSSGYRFKIRRFFIWSSYPRRLLCFTINMSAGTPCRIILP